MSENEAFVERMLPRTTIFDRVPWAWPTNKPVAVWILAAFEQFRIDAFNYPGLPDVLEYSRRDYGNRVGMARLFEVFDSVGVRGTMAVNGLAAEMYPVIVQEALKRDWELIGHGLTNSTFLTTLSESDERNTIRKTREILDGFGVVMRGWIGPGLAESWRTLDLLVDNGVEYVADWVNDDLPYRFSNGLYSLPYTLECNDMSFTTGTTTSPDAFGRRICDAFDVLRREGASVPRVMAICCHPFLTGLPGSIEYFRRALRYLVESGDAWFTVGGEVLDAYLSSDGSAHDAKIS